MHWGYRVGKQRLLDECEVHPEVTDGGFETLAVSAQPSAERSVHGEQRDHARPDLAGLVSDLSRKNTGSIAYRHGQE